MDVEYCRDGLEKAGMAPWIFISSLPTSVLTKRYHAGGKKTVLVLKNATQAEKLITKVKVGEKSIPFKNTSPFHC